MCARCHGIDGTGDEGPGLNRPSLTRGTTDDALREVIRDGIPDRGMPRVRRLTSNEVDQLVAYVRSLGRATPAATTGDAERGRAIYGRLGCASCHIVDGQGGSFGPDLSQIGIARGAAYLRQSFLGPAEALPRGSSPVPGRGFMEYLPVRIVAGDGHKVRGVRINEDPFTIQVRDVGNQFHSFRKSDVKSKRSSACSLIALNPVDGKITWHFQFTPHDIHDWDANEIPVLFDAAVNGRSRKLVAMANPNAFYYVLDRETGEFLSATPYAKQTWAERIDAKARPIRRPGTEPSVEGTLVFPNIQGASNWPSPSYSPQTKLFYQAARKMGTYFFKGESKYTPGEAFVAGGGRAVNGDDAWGAVRALEATTGSIRRHRGRLLAIRFRPALILGSHTGTTRTARSALMRSRSSMMSTTLIGLVPGNRGLSG
jgi:putative heme-binding domain-containing protein